MHGKQYVKNKKAKELKVIDGLGKIKDGDLLGL